ncbi:MAG: regulatory protein RecX [Lentisphaerae bacterium]|nr:regulatory protein RecX [Lentisphaerota bacterium]
MAKNALEKAMDFLAIRPLTERELRSKLQLSGRYSLEDIDEAVSLCRTRGYLNDELLAADAAQFLNSGGRGSGMIRKKLRARGVPDSALAQALEAISPEAELEAARNAADGKIRLLIRGKDMRKKKEKLFRFLISRGFAPDLCGRVIREKLAEQQNCTADGFEETFSDRETTDF